MYRRDRCACITEQDCPYIGCKCSRSSILCKADSMIRYVWLYQPRELVPSLQPIEFTAINDHATERCSMATDKLRCGMNNDICTILNRSYKVWSCNIILYLDFLLFFGLCLIVIFCFAIRFPDCKVILSSQFLFV